jgi:c-di-GMP-binding flagellar brake protein YcgR
MMQPVLTEVPMKTDRRKYPRVKIVQMILLSVDREEYFQVTTANISEGGLLCSSKNRIELYTRVFVMMEFEFEGITRKVSGEGEVIRVEKCGGKYEFAISFSTISESDSILLKKFIHAYK